MSHRSGQGQGAGSEVVSGPTGFVLRIFGSEERVEWHVVQEFDGYCSASNGRLQHLVGTVFEKLAMTLVDRRKLHWE